MAMLGKNITKFYSISLFCLALALINHLPIDPSSTAWAEELPTSKNDIPDWNFYRKELFTSHHLDDIYISMTNPMANTPENVAAGKKLYFINCAPCHGIDGYGKGYLGGSLDPPPARLTSFAPRVKDDSGYFFWTITEGGVKLGSAMPAFQDRLKQDEIWQIILFLKQL
ncbi:MAG: cytochrome c [Magnetococcus sp. DMHC-6]